MDMKTIYLIGFMGSGKSTVGKAYAQKYSKTYVDTDDYIEVFYGQKISEIFKNCGEKVFRTFETEILAKTTLYEVVSTGGGIIEHVENIQIMQKNGIIIYLHTSFAEIEKRLKDDRQRPLWNHENLNEKKGLYDRRISIYRKYADFIIQTDQKSEAEIVNGIKKCITGE